MAHKEMKEMLRAAAILSVASFIAKILAAIYRIPYQNIVGDEGFYVYQQVYPFYGLAMTLSLTGLPLFLSKMLQEKKSILEKKAFLESFFPIIFWGSTILFFFLFLTADFLSQGMGDIHLATSLKVVAFMYWLTPFLAVYRGYFQGIPWMTPTALSQVGEQFLRVVVIVLAAFWYLLKRGDVYTTSSLAFSGGILGGLLGLWILRRENKRTTLFQIHFTWSWFTFKKGVPYKKMLKTLAVEGGLLFVYSGLLILYQLGDSFLVKNALEQGGLGETAAKVSKGIFDRGQPLVQLGLVVALGLTSIFLPVLTKQFVAGKKQVFLNYSVMFLRLTTTLAFGATFGLIQLLPSVNYALFKDQAGLVPLRLFIVAILLVALIQAYENILQSQKSYKIPLKGALWGLVVKLLSTYPLTVFFQTTGTSLSTLLGLLGTLYYLKNHCQKEIRFFYRQQHFFKKLFVSLLGMAVGLLVYQTFFLELALKHRLWAFLYAVIGVVLGLAIFIPLTIRLHLFTIREWLLLPYGEKILRRFAKRK